MTTPSPKTGTIHVDYDLRIVLVGPGVTVAQLDNYLAQKLTASDRQKYVIEPTRSRELPEDDFD